MAREQFPDDPMYDPFTPEKVFVNTPNGIGMDVLKTVQNYAEAMLPEVPTSFLMPNDKLSIEFDNDTKAEYLVKDVKTRSLTFGSDDALRPELVCEDKAGNTLMVVGSAISPSGTMMTPGGIKQGYYLVTAQDQLLVSGGVVKDFAVERKESSTCEYEDVPLNRLAQKPEASTEYASVLAKFSLLTDLLQSTGFDFDENEEEIGYKTFVEHDESMLVYARRQGLGYGVIPQYEIYTYDAEASMLRAMRSIPGEGVFQMVVMHIDPVKLANTQIIEKGDWKKVTSLERSNLHRGSSNASFFTYTWQSPSQEQPVITILSNTHGLDEKILGAKAEANSSYNYVPVEVNIKLDIDHSAHAEAVNPVYWVERDTYIDTVSREIDTKTDGNLISCRIGDLKTVLPILPLTEMDAMESIVRSVVNNQHRRSKSNVPGNQ